jgi:hypothetical protein
LTVPNKVAIQPAIKGRIYSFKNEKVSLRSAVDGGRGSQRGWGGEDAAVAAGGVVIVRNKGGINRDGVDKVCILGAAKALKLPIARDSNCVPWCAEVKVWVAEVVGDLVWGGVEMKLPIGGGEIMAAR